MLGAFIKALAFISHRLAAAGLACRIMFGRAPRCTDVYIAAGEIGFVNPRLYITQALI
jgi:hypothetical protein